MKAKKLYLLPLLSLLASCVSSIPLRSDIREFIASFSLEESINTYVNAGYNRHEVVYRDNVKTEEYIEVAFNIENVNHPTYSYEQRKYIDDILDSTITRTLIYENEKIFYESEDGKVEYNLTQCRKLINTFFYTQTSMDGMYHSNGMYFGDYLIEMSRDIQNFVTINSDKTKYIFHREHTGLENGINATIVQDYSVNSLGMLEQYSINSSGEDGRYSTLLIEVFKN